MNKQIYTITDLQYGSTGKGLLAGWLGRIWKPDTLVTAWMPNAGHTYVTPNGTTMIHTALANGVVSPNLKRILIAPATVLDVDALMRETSLAIRSGETNGSFEILVHENTTILREEHRNYEISNITKIGSTQKGSGAAIMAKIRRDPQEMVTAGRVYPHGFIGGFVDSPVTVRVISRSEYLDHLYGAELLGLEGAQGYSLGIHSGFYPFTTSRECTVAQLCSDCLMDPALVTDKFGCMRTYPIRVANRAPDGYTVTGWSGPHYPDQHEISFEQIGQNTEYTTVTKLPRRIFTFSLDQVKEAIKVNGTNKIFMNFANYDPDSVDTLIEIIQNETGAKVSFTGWGPRHQDVKMRNGE